MTDISTSNRPALCAMPFAFFRIPNSLSLILFPHSKFFFSAFRIPHSEFLYMLYALFARNPLPGKLGSWEAERLGS
jgi:hypothetical protein